jgi:hypothetical protein
VHKELKVHPLRVQLVLSELKGTKGHKDLHHKVQQVQLVHKELKVIHQQEMWVLQDLRARRVTKDLLHKVQQVQQVLEDHKEPLRKDQQEQ